MKAFFENIGVVIVHVSTFFISSLGGVVLHYGALRCLLDVCCCCWCCCWFFFKRKEVKLNEMGRFQVTSHYLLSFARV
jgi:hypothetical protein